jgi:hypothetical protein
MKKNIWISVGYNIEGFSDRDFSRANYTAKGLYLQFNLKFDQDSVRMLRNAVAPQISF